MPNEFVTIDMILVIKLLLNKIKSNQLIFTSPPLTISYSEDFKYSFCLKQTSNLVINDTFIIEALSFRSKSERSICPEAPAIGSLILFSLRWIEPVLQTKNILIELWAFRPLARPNYLCIPLTQKSSTWTVDSGTYGPGASHFYTITEDATIRTIYQSEK